jgi:hypothetical protein
MTTDEVQKIAVERLGSWAMLCTEEHAMPMVLVAVGHDHKSGALVILTPDGGPTNRQMSELLYGAANILQRVN